MSSEELTWQPFDDNDETLLHETWVLDSGIGGTTVCVMGGVHGDEIAGLAVIDTLLNDPPTLKEGRLIVCKANLDAADLGLRFVDDNLNRAFEEMDPRSHEGRLASQLARHVLDSSDALLDLHSYTQPSEPFAIAEGDSSIMLARHIGGVNTVSSGWTVSEPGSTDWYMHKDGKPAVCIELGQHSDTRTLRLGILAVMRYLAFHDMIDSDGIDEPTISPSRIIHVSPNPVIQSGRAKLVTDKNHFEILTPGEVVAILPDGTELVAEANQVAVFPDRSGSVPEGHELVNVGLVEEFV